MAQSPASSPRLPSPPPIAEDQTGPTSPGVSLYEDQGGHFSSGMNNAADHGASRRIRPGTKAVDMAEGPPLVELSEIDSAFQLTEHLKALHYARTHPADSPDTIVPITTSTAQELAQPPPNTSEDIWLYELARLLIQKTNAIIVALFADSPPCSAQTCPEMRASEWQYLCAVHDPPKSCSAVDYCCHTLDWAATTLTSSKMFPSRLGLGGTEKVLNLQMKEITNIFRRVYRIYAHAWFQHREMFWRVEGKTGLYVFFKTICDAYKLIQPENYTIPPEAEGVEPPPGQKEGDIVPQISLMKREEGKASVEDRAEPMGNTILAAGDTTKRHRHTLSDRASSISTVIQEEAEEEEEEAKSQTGAGVKETKDTIGSAAGAEQDLSTPIMQHAPDTHVSSGDDANQNESAQDEEQEPAMGIARSETIKPLLPKEDDAELDAQSEEKEGEAKAEQDTAATETHPEQEGQKGDTLPQADVMEPSEASAADGEEASKTVAD